MFLNEVEVERVNPFVLCVSFACRQVVAEDDQVVFSFCFGKAKSFVGLVQLFLKFFQVPSPPFCFELVGANRYSR